METNEKIQEQSKIRSKKIITIIIAIIILGVGYYFLHNNTNIFKPGKPLVVVAKVPVISSLPLDPSKLTGDAKKAYDERIKWSDVQISNQPTLGKNTQSFALPAGWYAREDFLAAVVPQQLPSYITNYRTVIFYPSKQKSREDAIYTSPDVTNPYFKGHCHATTGKQGVCYGGTNPDTKRAFDLMFYFDK